MARRHLSKEPRMQSQISNIMNDLVQNPSEAIPDQVQAMSQRRWLIEADRAQPFSWSFSTTVAAR